MTDRELLAEYVSTGSDRAFAEIVKNHSGKVYGTCLRILGEPHAAEDATQAAFITLAGKARRLRRDVILGDWLFWTAKLCALKVRRKRERQSRHEREAAVVREKASAPAPSWDDVRPHLDLALASLPRRQREAAVLHYYYGKTQAEIARELGSTRTTIASRLSGALRRLRAKLAGRGVAVPAGLLAGFLEGNLVEAAPAGLAASIQSVCLGNVAASPVALKVSQAVAKALTWAKVKVAATVIAATATAGVGTPLALKALSGQRAGPPALPAAGPTAEVLGSKSFWRCYVVRGSELARTDSGKLQPLYELDPAGKAKVQRKSVLRMNEVTEPRYTPPPPAGWREPDFDDSTWVRQCGPFYEDVYAPVTTLCLRSRFTLKKPAALSLSVAFQGGAVAYLNGKELKRAHMPAGKISVETPAKDYPREAFIAPDGLLLGRKHGDPKKFADRFKMRTRRINALKIPASALRKGANVLAIEIHRAPAPEVMFTGKTRKKIDARRYCWWSRLSLEDVKLTAPAGVALTAPPPSAGALGVRVHNPLRKVFVDDSEDPVGTSAPIRICAARNGAFSGEIVVSSRAPIAGLKVSTTGLQGPGEIPASNVLLRFAMPDGRGTGSRRGWFDSLESSAPERVPVGKKAGAAVQPVWVTVNVPLGAKPGDYRGKLTVNAKGADPVEVPLHLKVIDWSLPNARDFTTHVGLIQSPDSVALQYGAKMWGAEHWKLLEKSFELLGQLGTDVVYIPLLRRTHFGNEHSMVRWMKGPDGALKPDFSIAGKYLDLAVKHLGKVPVVALYCWEPLRKADENPHGPGAGERDILISIIDPKTGKPEEGRGPEWGTPECRAFWKQAFQGMKGVLAKRGLEDSMMLGIFADFPPSKGAAADLAAAAANAKWMVQSHQVSPSIRGRPVGYATTPRRGISGLEDPAVAGRRAYGWTDSPFIFVKCPRGELQSWSPLAAYHSYAERWIAALGWRGKGSSGFGRIGADFWPVLKGERGRAGDLVNRYPAESSWGTLTLGYQAPLTILGPGRKGPVATVRSEMIRGGLQEAEARIFIEKALTDAAKRARLGKELAERCQAMLDERVRNIIRAAGRMEHHDAQDWLWFVSSGWQTRSGELYSAAAQIAKKLEIQ